MTSPLPSPDAAPDAAAGAARGSVAYHTGRLLAYRDDGPLAVATGHLTGHLTGRLISPLAAAATGAAVLAVLLVAGTGDRADLALIVPLLVLPLLGSGTADPHDGRVDWLVPPLVRGIEYAYLAVLGITRDVSPPLVYTLIGVLAYHHYDTVYRTRQRLWPRTWVCRAGLGWDGRMLLAAAAASASVYWAGALPFAYAALTVYLGVLFGVDSIYTWALADRGSGVMVNLEEEEETGS